MTVGHEDFSEDEIDAVVKEMHWEKGPVQMGTRGIVYELYWLIRKYCLGGKSVFTKEWVLTTLNECFSLWNISYKVVVNCL